MSNGEFSGDWAEDTLCWSVQLPDARGYEAVHADHMRVESGALVFTNGDIYTMAMVAVFGPNGYVWAGRPTPCGECIHRTTQDEEDE